MRIGLCYNLKDKNPEISPNVWDDSDAEYEDMETIKGLAQALEEVSGRSVVRLPCDPDLPERLESHHLDMVFNIAEGWGGRNREAYAPSLFEVYGIPYTGSDGLALSLTLDKVLAKKVLLADGLPTPEFFVVRDLADLQEVELNFPLFVKPCHEGTSKGIRNFSKVRNREELERVVAWVLDNYHQPALVERFVQGPEIAVSILGNGPEIRVLPMAEIRFTSENPFYSFECKTLIDESILCPASLDPDLARKIQETALSAYRSFGCRDFARLDFRVDAAGRPYILEVNPLPGLSSDYSLFPMQAAAAGMDYQEMVRAIIGGASKRYGIEKRGLLSGKGGGVRKLHDNQVWKDEIINRIRDPEELSRRLPLEESYLSWLKSHHQRLPFAVTPYLLSKADPKDPACPIRRQFLPSPDEMTDPVGLDDPLMEKEHEVAPGLIQVYPDRAAWCVSSFCPSLCRHCLRRDRYHSEDRSPPSLGRVEEVLHAVARNSEIRDLLLTGGDPLVYEDDFLEELLVKIRKLDQIQIIRIGTRLPCTLPQRVTPNLLKMLRQFHPIWISTQFNHPKEITPESAEACIRMVDAGIPVLNQSVLLKGINDSTAVLKELCEKLIRIRVRPYYLYQCQLVKGTAHFRTSVEKGMELSRSLRGRTSGFAIPQYLLDTPYGKVPLGPNYFRGREDGAVMMESFDGRLWKERNPL